MRLHWLYLCWAAMRAEGHDGSPRDPSNTERNGIMRRIAGRKLAQKLKDAKPAPAAVVLTQDDVNKMIHECFA